MDYTLIVAPSARRDLQQIVEYISFDNADTARRFTAFLVGKTKTLAQFPEIGRMVPEGDDPAIREIIVRAYRIVYRVDRTEQTVEIMRFWHAARGTPQL